MTEKIVLFGAGRIGQKAIQTLIKEYSILAVIDSNPSSENKKIYEINIISLQTYIEAFSNYKIVITANEKNADEIKELLKKNNITNFIDYKDVLKSLPNDIRPRLISYSMPDQLEDIILYNVFEDENDIFYIDVGSNDPFSNSVTKLFYDTKNAHGINIDPQQDLINYTNQERTKDINLCLGLGDKDEKKILYVQGGASTVLKTNKNEEHYLSETIINITTLAKVCKKYVSQNQIISFLKIDVEGFEKNVLSGADFKNYRPKVIVMEATLPFTDTPCYEEWEYILIENNYHFVYSYGVNRYYVANEYKALDRKFKEPVLDVFRKYKVFSALLREL